MNKKSYLTVLLICGLVLTALLLRNGGLILLSLPFLVYLMVGLLQAPTELRLVARRELSKTSTNAHQVVGTRIAVTNLGPRTGNLRLVDPPIAGITRQEGMPYCRISAAAGETIELAYTFSPRRGVYRWETIQATASDPLGLFEIQAEIPADGRLLVRPTPLELKPQKLSPRATLPTAGAILARKAGPGINFWGIRPYRPGDSLRRINWRLAARHPSGHFTNEYEREEIADFGLIVDARRRTEAADLESGLFEHSVSAAAAVGKSLLRNGNRVSLLVFGKTILTAFPGAGKLQLDLLLSVLARAKLSGNLSFANIERFPTRLFPARSLLFIFSPVDSRDTKAYTRLRSFGYEVILVSPDPVAYADSLQPPTGQTELASRAARVERVIQLKKLLKLGVQVIDWQVNQPLESLLQETARHMTRRRAIGR